jgi:hypothetical protein
MARGEDLKIEVFPCIRDNGEGRSNLKIIIKII